MRPSTEHTCAHCQARVELRGAQVFVPQPCPSCGLVDRARAEIGGYRLHEILKRNGLGVIFRAEDSAGASLAVKIVQPSLAAESTDIEYFVSEVWALARINHPNCLRIFATGVEHDAAWIAMEWLAHGSLADRLAERGRLREAEVLSIGVQVASALGAADAAGHSHRDLEPNNLVFADALTVKVTDFGQGALYQVAADDLGTMWGRVWYVAPERLRNEPEEVHSEVYSLGATLFHALTGTPLHGGEPAGQVMLDLLEGGEIRVEDFVDSLHERTASILNRMLASEPSQRFQYWSEVVTQLNQAGALVARRDAPKRLPAATPPKAPPPPAPPCSSPRLRLFWALVTLALLTLILVAGVFAWKKRPLAQPPRLASAAPQTPAATPAPIPSATPAPPPAPGAFDWRKWRTAALAARRGVVEASASVVQPSGALRLIGNGSGITATSEEAGFHFSSLEGNWSLTAHVVASDGAAGLSVRDMAANDRMGVSVWFTAERAAAAAVRKQIGARAELVPPVATKQAPWLRLTRRGPLLTAEYSLNGKQWKQIARLEGAPIGPSPVVGFLVWSGKQGRPATAVFDRIALARLK